MKMRKKFFLAAAVLLIMLTQIFFTVRMLDTKRAKIALPDTAILYNNLSPFPENISAVILTPIRDFSINGAGRTEAENIFKKIAASGADSVILNTAYGGRDILSQASEALKIMCETAQARKISVYINLDLSALVPSGYEFSEQADAACALAADIVFTYNARGFILSLPDLKNSQYEKDSVKWTKKYTLSMAEYVCAALKNCSNTLLTGISISEPEDAATLTKNGTADFIFLQNTESAGQSGIPVISVISESGNSTPYRAAEYPLIGDNFFNVPSKYHDFTVTEEITSVSGTGSFVTVNGKAIPSDVYGKFFCSIPLALGENPVNLKTDRALHSFTITRTAEIFAPDTLSPTGLIPQKYGDRIKIQIEALTDSMLTASFGDREIYMTQGGKSPTNAGYSVFYAEIPSGSEDTASRIYIKGSYGSIRMRITGALVTVTKNGGLVLGADNEPVIQAGIILPQELIISPPDSAPGKLVRITSENTLSYNPKCSEKLVPSPDYPRLAQGMLDYYVKTTRITERDVEMYVLASGRMVKASDAELLGSGFIGDNKISAGKVYMDGCDTIIEFTQTARTPYTISYGGFNYQKNIYGDWGDYFVGRFSPSELSIAFDYCTSAEGVFSFPENALFDKCIWGEKKINGIPKPCLTLDIRKGERFAGVSVSYTPAGNLRFRFNYLEQTLEGMTIVVDPGHGYLSADNYDPGAIGTFGETTFYEADINLAISLLVTEKLRQRGADVIRFNTEKVPYDTFKRSDIARQYSPDLFIAIHSDANEDSAAAGNSSHYFTPFSAALAQTISARIASFFTNTIYDGKNMCKGNYYDYFAVTTQQDFPSVLIETGFISNYREASTLAVAANQNAIADAIVDGIEDYLTLTE